MGPQSLAAGIRPGVTRALIAAILAAAAAYPQSQTYSALWGVNGEKWVPGAPLEDYSRAGYHEGNDALPRWGIGADVKDFGALGDSLHDDTEAFRRAIAACPKLKTVYIPIGCYKLTDTLRIDRDSIALRGEDMRKTRLFFPKGLHELYPRFDHTNEGAEVTYWSWQGGMIWFAGGSEKGIGNLTIAFPDKPYPGHFSERGWNALVFEGSDSHPLSHCWAANLRFYNCDNGAFVRPGGTRITFRNFTFEQYAGRPKEENAGLSDKTVTGLFGGHHAVTLFRSSACLVENVVFKNRFHHELSMEHGSHHNVWCRASGPDLHFDQHQAADLANPTGPESMHANLWTDIDAGAGTVIWRNNAGGSSPEEAYWNIRAAKDLAYPANPQTKDNIFVAFQGSGNPGGSGNRVEKIDPKAVSPRNLYAAQLKKRLGIADLAPEVAIARPLGGAKLASGSDLEVSVLADDRDGALERVDLYVNDALESSKTAPPFEWKVFGKKDGVYRLRAVAFDEAGLSARDTLSVQVGKGNVGVHAGNARARAAGPHAPAAGGGEDRLDGRNWGAEHGL
jgi:hypothetical protein